MKGNPNGPSDKGKGKGKQSWYPSSQQWMHMYPSRPQWQSNYQQYGGKGGKGGGKVNLFEAPNQLSMIQQFLASPGSGMATGPSNQGWQDDSGWSGGNFYSLVTKKKSAKHDLTTNNSADPVVMSNSFKALASKECSGEGPGLPTQIYNILDFVRPVVKQGIIKHSKRNRGIANKKKNIVAFSDKVTEYVNTRHHLGVPGAYAVPADEAGHAETPRSRCPVTSKAWQKDQRDSGSCWAFSSTGSQMDIIRLAKTGVKAEPDKNKKKVAASLQVLNTVPKSEKGNLCAMSEVARKFGRNWETLAAIVDSGASIPVFHHSVAAAYDLQESEASKAGEEYEIANGDLIPCLGQKRIAVLTGEGTLRGYGSQCADVAPGKALQSVRAMGLSGHATCFNMGPNGDQHMIINRYTGEVNFMEDDGINYIQRLLIVPPDQIEAVQGAINAVNEMRAQGFVGQGS